MKRIEYIMPIASLSGNISGRQDLNYDGVEAYETTQPTAASNYAPRLVACAPYRKRNYFCVRTKYTANITERSRLNLALMGGAGAIYSAVVRDKSSAIYAQCVAAKPINETLRAFLVPLLRAGLANKEENIAIADGLSIVNPWISSASPSVQVPQEIVDKFAPELSNS